MSKVKRKKTAIYNTSAFSRILKKYRLDNEWTQEHAASFWKLQRSVYSKYETGAARIPLDVCLMVCEELDLNILNFVDLS
jgi:DNA-binding XRE family transcriptional regulator